jgi:hypothetical protein
MQDLSAAALSRARRSQSSPVVRESREERGEERLVAGEVHTDSSEVSTGAISAT